MKRYGLIIFILFLASVLRFYQLGYNPPSLAWDETALGYNAYSIGLTGRDEFGRFLPINYFASFGDYKPPLYIYSAVLPVKIFGLNEFAVRFPSAFFGVLTVFLTYLLVRVLFPRLKETRLPELSAFFLTISPWHTQLSRAAWEANLALFFVVLGVYFWAKSIKDQPWFLVFSASAFVASFYTFNSARIFSPILVVGLALYYRKELWKIKKWLLVSFLIAVVLLSPLLPHLFSAKGRLRFQEVNIFSDSEVIMTANRWMEQDKNEPFFNIIHNRRVLFFFSFLKHYFDHFDGKFLFISGDGNPKFSLQDVGQLYWFDLPFLLAGVYFLFRNKDRAAFPLFWWLLVAPLPAAMARETPHALRILNSLPTWQIIIAYGFFASWQEISKKSYKKGKFFLTLGALFLIINVFYYLHHYYSHYRYEFSGEWQYGYKQAIESVSKVEGNYEKVIFTNFLGRPYIYFLFYKKYPPEKFWQYQDRIVRDPMGFIKVNGFDKYEFREFGRPEDEQNRKTLFVMEAGTQPAKADVIKEIDLLNGNPILVLFDLK